MNARISRVAVFGLLLLVALIIGTTYWQTWAAAGLNDRQDNAIQRVHNFTIERGLIKTRNGTVLAANRRKRVDGRTLYFRRYPVRGLFAHLVGYSTVGRARSGLESAENEYLTGTNANLSTVLNKVIDRIKGVTVKGNDLVLTVDPQLQRLAMNALAGQCGAAVMLEPRTGRVTVMTSMPTYDTNLVEGNFKAISNYRGRCRGSSPLLNRATQGLFVPGSTFKVVTAAAALDSGAYSPASTFVDPGFCIEYGKRVSNAGNPETGPESFGFVNFSFALQHSINSVFCNVGKRIGAGTIIRYAQRFGFYTDPPLETPADERAPSGLYDKGKLFLPKNPETDVDPGRFAFGQERLLVTPLQLAMVAATIANGGVLMQPYVVHRVVAPDGTTVARTTPKVYRRVIKRQTAIDIASMMEAAVRAGTSTNAQIPGVRVAGKTGTAETGIAGTNTTSFISFAPVDDPKIAVAVVLENQQNFAGVTAAPIAKNLMQAYLRQRSKP